MRSEDFTLQCPHCGGTVFGMGTGLNLKCLNPVCGKDVPPHSLKEPERENLVKGEGHG